MQFDMLMLTISFTHHQSDTSNAFKKKNYLFDCLTWSYTSNHVLKWYMKLIQTFFLSRNSLKLQDLYGLLKINRPQMPQMGVCFHSSIYVQVVSACFCHICVQCNIHQVVCEHCVGCVRLRLRRVITKRKHILSPYNKKYF